MEARLYSIKLDCKRGSGWSRESRGPIKYCILHSGVPSSQLSVFFFSRKGQITAGCHKSLKTWAKNIYLLHLLLLIRGPLHHIGMRRNRKKRMVLDSLKTHHCSVCVPYSHTYTYKSGPLDEFYCDGRMWGQVTSEKGTNTPKVCNTFSHH